MRGNHDHRTTPEILRTEGLSKFFHGVKALDNVDFSLRRGDHGVARRKRGGKSTLIKTLTGVYHADRGAIWLEGNAISPKTPHMPSNWGSARSTEVNLLPNMSVADNLFIGREPRRFGLLRRKEMEARAAKLMESYGFSRRARTAEPFLRGDAADRGDLSRYRSLGESADPR